MTGFPRAGGLRLIRIVLVAVAIGTVINTGAGVALFLLNSDRVDQINEERARNVVRNCEDVNQRHDGTVRALDELLERASRGASTAERARLRQSRESTLLLVDALVPRRDCAALVARQINP